METRGGSRMIDSKTGKIYTNIWFGSFYRPAYDDEEAMRASVHLLKELGFNSVLQDAKAWEDFEERFQGGAASRYVQTIEAMQKACAEEGMSHEFLALYLCGDNLYPDIRFSRPVLGEGVTGENGEEIIWYRYWSAKARASQEAHVRGLLTHYRNGHVNVRMKDGESRLPICSMWDPIAAASFDEEGRQRYLSWLCMHYHGDIAALNALYRTDFQSFFELNKEDYWFSCHYPGRSTFTEDELNGKEPAVYICRDNLLYKRFELKEYFRDMQQRLHAINPELFLVPNLTQWGYFLNVDGSMLTGVGMADLWDTAVRGIDLYELAEYVDAVHFISVPVTPYGDPDAYVVSCSHSMMRAMNRGREWIGGIYWGRYLYNDIYSVLTPEEIIGSMTAAGMAGYTSYGLGGMDDGGVLQKMPQPFLDSLKRANMWMQDVIPQLGSRLPAHVAILFPTAMAAFVSYQVEGSKERRLDLLGWYRHCLDLGFDADVIDRNAVLKGALQQYSALIIPADNAYDLDPDPAAEECIRQFVKGGGILLHGPQPAFVQELFGITAQWHEAAPVQQITVPGKRTASDVVIPQGDIFLRYSGEAIAAYVKPPLKDGDYPEAETIENEGAVVCRRYGQGTVCSFGFLYGYSYIAKVAPHVARKWKNNCLYPMSLSDETYLEDILKIAGLTPMENHGRGIETAMFENGEIVVNHTSYPFLLEDGSRLEPRSARFLPAS